MINFIGLHCNCLSFIDVADAGMMNYFDDDSLRLRSFIIKMQVCSRLNLWIEAFDILNFMDFFLPFLILVWFFLSNKLKIK